MLPKGIGKNHPRSDGQQASVAPSGFSKGGWPRRASFLEKWVAPSQLASLLIVAGGHRQLYDNVSAALARIREAARECAAVRLREVAHRLRMLFSTFSATTGDAAARLETMGESGRQADASSTLDNLTELVGPVIGGAVDRGIA
jgi:hypothetical protein